MRLLKWLQRPAPRFSPQMYRPRLHPRVLPRLEELETRVTPTGNIVLTNAFLVNVNDQAVTTPDKGEEIFLEADWTTQGLPSNASYRVSYSVDGVTLSTNFFGYGGGNSGTQSWYWYLGGWYAAPGTHAVTVTVDPDQSVAETSYADNSKSFNFTPASATDLPHKFITPLGGTPYQTWGIVNYVDVNPLSPGYNDYTGGDYTYDGHTGHDMTLANFGSMDAGVPDLAAAAGTVVAVQDGNYDRNTVENNVPANYVEIDNGNGWHTIYYHFRTDSILVHVGDTVVAGQVLGLAGSSGYSTGAHLHFEVQHNGDVVEEEDDPTTFWTNPLTYQGSLSDVLDSSVTSTHTPAVNDLNAEERPVAANTFSEASGQEVTVWFEGNTRNNDQVNFKFFTPGNTEFTPLDYSFTASESHGGYWYYFNTLPANMAQGTWHVNIFINGVQMASDPFQVNGTGAGAAHLSQGSTYVPNGRTTPIDFGTVALNASPPQLTFTVSNLGSATLSLSNLVLPSGFSLVGSFPSSVAIGGSATFKLQMATGTAGSNAGIVQFTTSDPNAPTYAFDVKGTVSGGNTGALHGQVFHDVNGDGIEMSSDTGLMGWTVTLLNPSNNNVLATTTTGFNGYYAFLNLAASTYRVRETPPTGWSQSTANPADVTVGSSDVLVSPFGVGMYAATHFSVSAPATATAGTAFNFTVTALDQFNTPVVGYSGLVHFTSSDGQAVLPGNSTLTNGVGTFSATLKTAGSQTLTATDTVTSATGTSSVIAVSPASATHFSVSAPSSATAGTAFNFTITALDPFNNTATGYSGTIHYTSTDAAGTLPADGTLTNGSATLSATLRTAGNQTLTATDTVTGSITGTSGTISVSAAAATHFTGSAPASTTAGSAFGITLTALDPFNNTAKAYRGTVHFTKTDSGAGSSAPPDYPFVAGDNGVHTFTSGVTFVSAGNQTVTATDITTSSITGSATVTVNAAAATHFSVSAPTSTTAGSPFLVSVLALDPYNNTVVGYSGTVHFTSTDGQAVLPGNSTLSNGSGTFIATLKTAGNQTLTATDTANSTITGTSGSIAVSAAAATHFSVGAPASATAGSAFSITLTALDAFNNTAKAYTGTVHFTKTDNGAGSSVPADYTFVAGDNGSHTFPSSVTLVTAGNQTVSATDTANSAITGTSNSIAVSATTATHFSVSTPATATAGVAFTFTVKALDAFNNTATGYNGTVHFTSTDPAASLPSDSTLSNGTGSFSATLNTRGSQTLTATDTVTSSLTGTSAVIAVRGLVVSSFTPTPTGFSVSFSKPFVNSSTSPLNLYDAASAGYGAADVTLVGSGTIGSVRGSLIIDPSNTSFTFLKTGGPVGGGTTGLLAAGTYIATLVSGSTAFKDATGAPLDGNSGGTNGGNYTATFTVTAPTGVTVTIPDFARGPDSTDAINVPNNAAGNGIPVALSNGAGVTDGTFILQYNANLLTISGGSANPALTGATFTVTTSGSGASAQATIVFHSPTALATGAVRLGGLTATVPSNAQYKSKELLHWSSLSLNNGAIATVADDGVHAVVFLGDASGDGTYTSADSVLLSRVASAADSGFAAFPVLDPVLVGDINGDGRVTAADGGLLNNYVAGSSVLQIPPYPGPPSNNPSGPDPALSIPTNLQVGVEGTVTVPVNIDDAHPAGSTGLTQAVLALRYDPAVFSVSAADIHLGSVPGAGWTLQAQVDAATGQIGIVLFSATPSASTVGGSLVTITFHVQSGAPLGMIPVNLVAAVNPNGQGVLWTALNDDQGPLTLHPVPMDAGTGVGGLVVLTMPGGTTNFVDHPLLDLARSMEDWVGQPTAGSVQSCGQGAAQSSLPAAALLGNETRAQPYWLPDTDPVLLSSAERSRRAPPPGNEPDLVDLIVLDDCFAQIAKQFCPANGR